MSPNLISAAANVTPCHPFSPKDPMTITLLLDLDDTLLKNDIQRFMPAYLKALSKKMAKYCIRK